MRTEYEGHLLGQYPKLFEDRNARPLESSMCWGFQCGDGWFHLVEAFCQVVERLIALQMVPPVKISQVKSKLGTLGIHFRGGNDRVQALSEFVWTLSEKIGEDSGIPKKN